ncbi:3'-5' exonuclease [Marinitenerispora sediminis]|uniref:DNA polymerase III subunit epsilon n=1 Tax=Marinitenerispora sediminis TaxID=1931232 RepID=A0A368T774_9ACTN|nr:3'-5' exonuclease [Marinitenerispora sediminis]RCV52296.1 DNA polymerase III subunit epsilon [Marinitenerispora sediminis]RCV58836.1 DNA polymerase III subunit epsilon [Marinitenerispora sediminis]RCV59354.1 DNA polymerase III subunit epsilon [Marinitenerispora sediminis]
MGALTRSRAGRPARDLEYAVIDVETTGLDPVGGARVCEVAVLRMRGDGTVLREFTTLLDPRGPVTGQEFHGIGSGDVVGAPSAADIADELARLCAGAVVVGHKLDFEEGFLAAEFGAWLPDGMPGLCTLRALRSQLDLERYSLPWASHTLNGHWPTGQHTALGDARACAQLLAELLHNAPGELRYTGPAPLAPPPAPLPEAASRPRLKPRRRVDGLTARLPNGGIRSTPAHPLRPWPACWRPDELDAARCGGRFDPEQRAAAAAAAARRRRRREAAGAAVALTGAAATAAAVAAVRRRLRGR